MGNITSLKFVKKLNILALSMVLFGPSLATAQDEALEETLVNSSETEDQSLVSDAVDEIIVTGSRLKRDTIQVCRRCKSLQLRCHAKLV